MINRRNDILILTVLLLIGSGCQSTWFRKEPRYVDPALPASMSYHELINYLNNQNQGLEGWRCTSTVMWVRLPNGLRQRLPGMIACQAPHSFRLTAKNTFVDADLGSNASHCWMLTIPGEPAVLKWRHEDTALLQQMPNGMPHIDPKWLMQILGIKPLDPNEYQLSRAPAGTEQLWLTAIEDTPGGRPIRRVIKVDRMRGVVCEHVVFDSDGHAIARAALSRHKSHNGHLIPGEVKLEFPETDSEISLKFKTIETNPHLPDELWHIPDRNMRVVDLGDLIRAQTMSQRMDQFSGQGESFGQPRATLQPPVFDTPIQSAFGDNGPVFDGGSVFDSSAAANSRAAASEFDRREIAEPDWDTPISFSRSADENGSFQTPPPRDARPNDKRGGFFWRWKR